MDKKNMETRRRFLKKSTIAVGAITLGNACSGKKPDNEPDYSIPENGFHGKSENMRDWSGRS